MDKEYLDKLKKRSELSKVYNRDQFVADEIYKFFGKKIAFPLLMRLIKTHGNQFVYETYNEIRQGNAKSPVALFMWKMKQNKIKWNDELSTEKGLR